MSCTAVCRQPEPGHTHQGPVSVKTDVGAPQQLAYRHDVAEPCLWPSLVQISSPSHSRALHLPGASDSSGSFRADLPSSCSQIRLLVPAFREAVPAFHVATHDLH